MSHQKLVRRTNCFNRGNDIKIDVPQRRLEIIGIEGKQRTSQEITKILKERHAKWKPKEPKYKNGILSIYTNLLLHQ
ncbi:MAG: hypothetical protein ACLRQF_05790 [Thomasclavelia ramosa]